MFRDKKVVVIMPAYNAEKTLEQTVSILDELSEQVEGNWIEVGLLLMVDRLSFHFECHGVDGGILGDGGGHYYERLDDDLAVRSGRRFPCSKSNV